MVRDAVRDFVTEQITPHAARWDKEHHFPHDVHQGLAAWGPTAFACPKNGAVPAWITSRWRWCWKKLPLATAAPSTAISVTNCPVNAILMRYGNAAQKQQWLGAAGARRDAGRVLPDRAACGL